VSTGVLGITPRSVSSVAGVFKLNRKENVMRPVLRESTADVETRGVVRARSWVPAAIGAAALSLSLPVAAEIYQISGIGFTQHCPCVGDPYDDSQENNGVLLPDNVNMRLFAPIEFPNGQRVCRFSLIYNDINANDPITARLKRKAFTVGGNAFAAPQTMATAVSANTTNMNLTQRATTTAITNPVINDTSAFYYVELTVPTINLRVLGVQVDVRPTCT
jgi:hypothetical protein